MVVEGCLKILNLIFYSLEENCLEEYFSVYFIYSGCLFAMWIGLNWIFSKSWVLLQVNNKSRVSNTSGFYLHTTVGPVISTQFRTIPCNTRTVACNSAQFRAIPANGIPIENPKQKSTLKSPLSTNVHSFETSF